MIEDRGIAAGGRRVRYLAAGEGEPLLLLHAFPLSSDMWRPQLAQPPAGWRVLAPDLRGFGGTSRASDGAAGEPGATSIDAHARDVLAFVDALGIGRFAVAGLSMGGYVVFGLLRHDAGRLRAIVLADTRAEDDSDAARANRTRLRTLLAERGVAAVADSLLPGLLGPTTHATRPDVVAFVRRIAERQPAPAVDDALQALAGRPDSTPLLASLRVPVLIVAGDEDALTPWDVHERLHAAVAASMLIGIPTAGHLCSLEQPAMFSDALERFLHRVRNGDAGLPSAVA